MLSVVMMSVIMLSDVTLNVVILSVVAPIIPSVITLNVVTLSVAPWRLLERGGVVFKKSFYNPRFTTGHQNKLGTSANHKRDILSNV